MALSGTNKHWREFNIYTIQVNDEQEEQDEMMERLGLPNKRGDKPKHELGSLAKLSLPLEDVSEYYDSYNTSRNIRGVAVTTYAGSNFFLIISYEEFRKLRIELGIEKDPDSRPWYKRLF